MVMETSAVPVAMPLSPIFFWLFAAISVGGGIITVTRKSPLSAALGLALSLIAVAGLFAQLSAHLLFILQILVYAGAIVVLIIFVIMLINQEEKELEEMRLRGGRFVASAVICAAGCVLTLRALRGLPNFSSTPVRPDFGTAVDVARVAFGAYVIPFEILGLILLVGIIGAVLLAKRGE
jgi:NADH-quinone oxidoreductase subunit J